MLLHAAVVFYFALLYNFYCITYDNLFVHSISERAIEIIIFVVCSLFYPEVFKFVEDKIFTVLLID